MPAKADKSNFKACFMVLTTKNDPVANITDDKLNVHLNYFLIYQIAFKVKQKWYFTVCQNHQDKKESKDQESIQSSTTPDPGYKW